VGAAIASRIPRDELFVTTKLWNSRQTDAHSAMRESLDKLGLDRVDLYLIHWPTPERNTFVQAWLDLEEIRSQGLATSIGVSNFMPEHLEKVLDQGSVVPAVNQIEVHPTLQQREAVAANEAHGIVTEAWSPLGRGKADDLTSPVVTGIADAVGRTPAQVLLRWHVQRGHVVFPKSSLASASPSNTPLRLRPRRPGGRPRRHGGRVARRAGPEDVQLSGASRPRLPGPHRVT
jgi:2,5-diketo-D-gluconate reductase A